MAHRKENGVPLPEVLFCALILGLLAAVVIPSIVYSADTRAAQCRANVELLDRKIRFYADRHSGWTPADTAEFKQMVARDPDLRGALPKCPYGKPYVFDPATGRIVPHNH